MAGRALSECVSLQEEEQGGSDEDDDTESDNE